MSIQLGSIAPDFTQESTEGTIRFRGEDIAGCGGFIKWSRFRDGQESGCRDHTIETTKG